MFNTSNTYRSFTTTAAIVDGDATQPPQASKSKVVVPEVAALPLTHRPHIPVTLPPHKSMYALLPKLRTQPPFYTRIHIHARAYLVTQGNEIRLPFLMPNVALGTVLRLNRASIIGSRDYTLKGYPYIDERMFECRATVIGVESEPMRLKIKKKQRQRRTTTVKSKHRYTVLRISEFKLLGLPEEDSEAVART